MFGAEATVVRNGKTVSLYQGMLINSEEATTVKVAPGGRVMYTVDERDIAYFTGPELQSTSKKIIYPEVVKATNGRPKS